MRFLKNKTLAFFGMGTYLLSVLSSATDLEGKSKVPTILIAISAVATLIFVIMATVRLWKKAKYLPIMIISSGIVLIALSVIQDGFLLKDGSNMMLIFNLTRVVNTIALIGSVVALFKITPEAKEK